MTYTSAIIDLQNLESNLRVMQKHLGTKGQLCTMIKADAYGHGDIPIARSLEKLGVPYVGVSSWYEGSRLREAGVSTKIIQFCPARVQNLEDILLSNVEMVVSDEQQIQQIIQTAKTLKVQARVHLKVDIGMHRLGCRPEHFQTLLNLICSEKNLSLEGVCTHLPNGEEEHNPTTQQQIDTFYHTVSKQIAGINPPPLIHLANSATLCNYPIDFHTLARPGLGIYGYHANREIQKSLKPVMTLTSRLMSIKKLKKGESCSYGGTWTTAKDTNLGIVAIGYGDGFPRSLSNRGRVTIEGKTYPIVGNICMDLLMVDLGSDSYPVETVVILFGEKGPSIEEVAELNNTIVYEILCGISKRVKRIYT